MRTSPAQTAPGRARSLLFLLALTALVTSGTLTNGFTLYDDPQEIYKNPVVVAGAPDSLPSLWTRPDHSGIYMPLTYTALSGLAWVDRCTGGTLSPDGVRPFLFHLAGWLFHAALLLYFAALLSRPAAVAVPAVLLAFDLLVLRTPWRRSAAALSALLAWRTVGQTAVWRDSRTLFSHALSVNPESWFANSQIGSALSEIGAARPAAAHLRRSLELRPDNPPVQTELARLYLLSNERDDARKLLQASLALNPDHAPTHDNLGLLALLEGRLEDASSHLTRALEIDPTIPSAHNNLGVVRTGQGDFSGAVRSFRTALAADPGYTQARINLCHALIDSGETEAAKEEVSNALRRPLTPLEAEAFSSLLKPQP